MTATAHSAGKAGLQVWIGRALSTLVVLFLLMDAGMKLAVLPVVVETGEQLGWAGDTARPLGVTLLICTLLYVYPGTAVLGAVLLTAYLGGAVATHTRIGSPIFSHMLFGVYLALLAWGGLYLRDEELRRLIPLRRA